MPVHYATIAAPLTEIDREINDRIRDAHTGRPRFAMTMLDAIESDFILRRAKIQADAPADESLDWRGMVRAGFTSY